MTVNKALGVLAKPVGIITEGLDAVNALYKALPERVRIKERRPSPARKVELIYRHFYELDLLGAFENLALNEIQDAAIGSLAQGASGLNRSEFFPGRPIGIQSGPAL